MEIDLMQLLGSYAFPIVMCILMGWYIKYITDKNRDDMKEEKTSHETIMLALKDSIQQAINNNTLALNKLCSEFEFLRKEKEK